MKNRARIWILILCTVSAVFAALAVYGGIAKREVLLCIGMSVAVMALLLLPAFFHRSAALKKLREQKNPLSQWQYSHYEAQYIAQEHKHLTLKRSLGLACLFTVCFVIILLPFFIILLQREVRPAPIVFILMGLVPLMPWLTALIAPSIAAQRVLQHPCVTLIGRDYLMVANTYHPLNDRQKLNAVSAQMHYEPDGTPKLRIVYANAIRMKTGWINRKDTVDILIPRGQEPVAQALAAELS